MLPPCLVDTVNYQTTGVCEMVSECTNDVKNYALKAYTNNAKTLKVIGLGKTGHLVYGPYDETGTLIDCKTLDMCHGKYINGSYAYVWTNTWPYSLACSGPGAIIMCPLAEAAVQIIVFKALQCTSYIILF